MKHGQTIAKREQYALSSCAAIVIAADVVKLTLYPKLARHRLSMIEKEHFDDLGWKRTSVRVYNK